MAFQLLSQFSSRFSLLKKHSSGLVPGNYPGDPESLKRALAAIANQGKAKRH